MTGTNAFNIASLNIMYRKILDALTILVTVSTLGIFGTGFFTYKYLTSEQFKAKMMNQVLENVQGFMPKVLDNALPDKTGFSITTPPSLSNPSKK